MTFFDIVTLMISLITTILLDFASMTIMALPFFVLAIVLSSFIETRFSLSTAKIYLNKGKISLLYSALLGASLPGCACATVPIAKSLKAKGVRLPALATFMMVSPLIGPHTIVLTYGLLGLKFTIGRLIAALIGGVGLGLIMEALEKRNLIQMPETTEELKSCCHKDDHCEVDHKKSFLKTSWETTLSLGKYFLVGLLVASAIIHIIPPYWIMNAKNHPVLAYAIVILMGIPIYVCEGEEVPIVKALLDIQFPVGPAFSLMIAAVGTCIPTLLMAQKIIGKKPVLVYLIYWIVMTPIFGIVFSMLTQ